MHGLAKTDVLPIPKDIISGRIQKKVLQDPHKQNNTMSTEGYFPPTITFNTLPHADGSATYEGHGYTVVGAVNGPLEAQRRDELPDETFLEVNLRPANGPGGMLC